MKGKITILVLSLLGWILLYTNLEIFTDSIVYSLLKLKKESPLTSTVYFFIYEVPKVLLLLTLIVFVVGIIRSYFSPERTRKMLGGKKLFAGNVLASLLGIVTPFSCYAINTRN